MCKRGKYYLIGTICITLLMSVISMGVNILSVWANTDEASLSEDGEIVSESSTDGLFRPEVEGVAPVRQDIVNGDFRDGLDEWDVHSATLSVSDGTVRLNATANGGHISQSITQAHDRDKIFYCAIVKSTSASVYIQGYDGLTTTKEYHSGSGKFELLGLIKLQGNEATTTKLYIKDSRSTNRDEVQLMDAMVINMTSNGIEDYTEEQMLNIVRSGYWEGIKTTALSYDLVSEGQNKFNTVSIINDNYFVNTYYAKEINLPRTTLVTNGRLKDGKSHSSTPSYFGICTHTSPNIAGADTKWFVNNNSLKEATFDNSNGKYKYFVFYNREHMDFWYDIADTYNLQITKGLTPPTNYIPYTSSKTEFNVPRPMTKIGKVYDNIDKNSDLIYRNDEHVLTSGDIVRIDTSATKFDIAIISNNILTDAKDRALWNNVYQGIATLEGYVEKEYSDTSANIGSFYLSNPEPIKICLTKGTTLDQARAMLVGKKIRYILETPQIIHDGQQGYKAPSPIQVIQNGDLVQYATSIKQVNLTDSSTIVLSDKCTDIIELTSSGQELSGTLSSDGRTIQLVQNHTGMVYVKCKIDPSTYLDVTLEIIPNIEATENDGSITISWDDVTGADGYSIKRGTISGGPYTSIASNLTSTVYEDVGLTNGTTYYYLITANVGGNIGSSDEIMATPHGAPLQPTNIAVENGYQSTTLSWEEVKEASRYKIQRSTSSGGPYMVVGNVTYTTYRDTNLNIGTKYYYVVTAVNNVGESPHSDEVIAIPISIIPEPPANIDSLAGNHSITLTWSDMLNTDSYIIKRSTTSGGPYNVIASNITTNIYTDTQLLNGMLYYYIIIGKNQEEESVPSREVEGVPGIQSPTNIILEKVDEGIHISWNIVEGANTYKIKRAEAQDGPYTVISNNITGTDYMDTTIQSNTLYYYKVSAIGSLGESPDALPISLYIKGANRERYILLVTLINGMQMEYDMSSEVAIKFITWYTNRANGIGSPFFTLFNEEKQYVYSNSKDYIGFNTILYYQLNEYKVKTEE